ncbi:Short-chain dehydrogenase/reductase [Parasponia andersonii]|uniref:Short-chain dehydrogenase/reductase n=1 Tax=Parasponia andersonii TaxID=3476 RepID=A0A2P5DVD5_PARAD|nr:Short-chain dehydrogenase/reductase [Parasponia andersonii]
MLIFWGTINGIHFAIQHLKKTRGKIVLISSICGWYPLPTLSIYSASKAAMMNFCEALRTELGSTIGITVVTPGLIETKMTHDWRNFKSIMPEESAKSCAKAIVRSACRGDSYLMEPSWLSQLSQ